MEKTIFVQIASYRDSELPKTIADCLEKAANPSRLTFGVCWQYDEETYTDLDQYLTRPNFRVSQHYYQQSQGCCWARHNINRLYQGEDYTLQIDAHTRFCEDWDEVLIEMIESIDSGKPIISTYPPPYIIENGIEQLIHDRGIQKLKLASMKPDFTATQTTEKVKDPSIIGPSPLLAAGFLFTLGKFCSEVPYDPELYFNGEEISLAVRAYTSGYSFFYPNQDVLWHLYNHANPLHWSDHNEVSTNYESNSKKRLKSLLTGDDKTLGVYGLGNLRTLAEFEQYSGISFNLKHDPIPEMFDRTIEVDRRQIEDRADYLYWILTLVSSDGEELFRYDIDDTSLLTKRKLKIRIHAQLADQPTRYVIWPYSKKLGYTQKVFFDLPQIKQGCAR